MIIYDEHARFEGNFDPSRVKDATKLWLTHYENELYLSFIYANGTAVEKHQAYKELVICKRKQEYWRRHGTFEQQTANEFAIKAKRKWK